MEKLLKSLQTQFSESIVTCDNGVAIDIIVVTPDLLLPVIQHLHDVEKYDYLVDIVASHWPDENSEHNYEVTYNLYCVDNKTRLFLKVRLTTPKLDSVYHIYKSADFMEREQYDMVGIVFEGHPNLKRIYMPEYFEGHPLMKTYGEKDRSWFNLGDEMGHGLTFTNLGEKYDPPTPKPKPTPAPSVGTPTQSEPTQSEPTRSEPPTT